MAARHDVQPLGPPAAPSRATYTVDAATVANAHRSLFPQRHRLGTICLATLAGISALLTIFGQRSSMTDLMMIAVVLIVLARRYRILNHLAQLRERNGNGDVANNREVEITLVVRPDVLEIDEGQVVSQVRWSHFTQYRKSSDYLLLSTRRGGGLFIPRRHLSPGFEASLDSHLHAGAATTDVSAPTPLLMRGLHAMLLVSLLFLVICVVAVLAAGGPKERIGTCPEGQIAIVTQDLQGNTTVICQYRLDS